MEGKLRWSLLAAVAPLAWGSNYFVVHQFLPVGFPLAGAALRALPAGLLLMLIVRRLPTGAWIWRSFLLGMINTGGFFALVYLAATLLPTNLAATIMGASPLAMILFAWLLLAESPRPRQLFAAVLGVGGVAIMVLGGVGAVNAGGVLASFAAMALSSLGFVLTKRWARDVAPLSITAWQLTASGLVLAAIAIMTEGVPPVAGPSTVLAFGYVTVIATALAYGCWFTALRHTGAGTVGLVGLLNPVTGLLLGTLVAAEPLSARQLVGVLIVLGSVVLGQATFGRHRRREVP